MLRRHDVHTLPKFICSTANDTMPNQWNNRPMDQLRSLRVFTQVIAEGSFAGAARVLDLAPAVVTRAIAELEQHLGARLLNRTTRSLALTEIGEAYLERAQGLLADLEDADACAGSDTKTPRGTLRVLCPPAFATHQLAKHLPRFRALYPQITLELATPGPVDVADENFDISILSIGQQPLQGDFVAHRLACSSFIVCASPRYLDRCGHPETPGDLRTHEALLPAVNALRRDLTLFRQVPDATVGATNVVTVPLHPPALFTTQLELIYAAAVAGLGIAGLPSFMTEEALRDGRLQRVLPQWRGTTLTLYAAMPTRKHVPARTRALMDFLVAVFGGVQSDPWLPGSTSGRRG
jgi:DNA-binding transcriptional LysR family regulator